MSPCSASDSFLAFYKLLYSLTYEFMILQSAEVHLKQCQIYYVRCLDHFVLGLSCARSNISDEVIFP